MIGTDVSCSTPTRLRGRPPLISNALLDLNFPSLFNSTSASTFIFHHVCAAIVFSDLAPFTSSSSILNKDGATFTHLSASPSHTPSYIVRSRLRHSSSLLNSTYRREVRYSFNGVDVERNLENPHFPVMKQRIGSIGDGVTRGRCRENGGG
ncbi:unnamed protein product [Vicia faba]|uniref:Uncharacterized protein n=1 Tax=Vicia faba TaxID=3906 RepID=A0AAV0Z4R3_VICFA|nr:unnamed protein product [Vicia faba]